MSGKSSLIKRINQGEEIPDTERRMLDEKKNEVETEAYAADETHKINSDLVKEVANSGFYVNKWGKVIKTNLTGP